MVRLLTAMMTCIRRVIDCHDDISAPRSAIFGAVAHRWCLVGSRAAIASPGMELARDLEADRAPMSRGGWERLVSDAEAMSTLSAGLRSTPRGDWGSGVSRVAVSAIEMSCGVRLRMSEGASADSSVLMMGKQDIPVLHAYTHIVVFGVLLDPKVCGVCRA